MKNFSKLGLPCLIGSVLFTSCQKNIDDNSAPTEPVKDYAEFASVDDFRTTIKQLESQSGETLKAWEQQNGIVSLRSRFNEVVKAEEINGDQGKAPLTTKEALKYSYVFIKSPDGGIEPNIALWSMMNIVNEKGIVKIGNHFYQYTFDKVKSIPDVPQVDNELDLLLKNNVSKPEIGLAVNVVTRSTPSINAGGRSITTIAGRQCENTKGDNRVIGYEEVIEIQDDAFDYNCNPTVVINADGTQSFTYACSKTNITNARWYEMQVKIRTLRKGLFGAWNNRNTTLQYANGSWKMFQESDLKPGWESGNTGNIGFPKQLNTYSKSNQDETSTYSFTMIRTKKNGDDANIRFDSSSQHFIHWGGSYDCHCTI